MGRGINRQIRRAYGWLSTRYRPGDRVFLFGYSRGAYAVRSLAGIMDQVGLLKAEHATERNVHLAYRYYQREPGSPGEAMFAAVSVIDRVGVEMIGAFDTVKALGVRLPFLWMWTEPQHEFHNHALGPVVQARLSRAGARREPRRVSIRSCGRRPMATGGDRVEQVWFRGAHGDVGGQLAGIQRRAAAANISAGLDAGEGRGLRTWPFRPTGARIPDGSDRALCRHDAGLGQGVLAPRQAAGRPRPVRKHPPERGRPVVARWLAPAGVAVQPPDMIRQVVEPVA